MGGRVAEEMFLGDISSGASGDIKMATWYAKKMVCEWGMSGRMGMVEYGEHEDYVFLGRDIGRSRGYSEQTAREIDEEVHKIVNGAYDRAKKILEENRAKVELIASALLEYETLDGSQVEEIVKYGKMNNPPPKGISAPTAPTPSEPLPATRPVEKAKDKSGILPGLEGAPAGA
jgi:cell division protease FtsH